MLRDDIIAWLRSLRVSQWGPGGWDLQDDKEIGLVAEWYLNSMNDFHHHRQQAARNDLALLGS